MNASAVLCFYNDFQDFHETRKNTHPRIKIPYSKKNGSSQFQKTRKHSHQIIKIPRLQENGPSQLQDFQETRKNRVKIPDNRLLIVPENSHELPKIPRRKKIEKHCTFKIDENKLEIAKKEECNTSNEGGRDKNKVMMTKTFLHSKSDIVKRVVIDESKNIVRRVETFWYDNSSSDGGEEESDNEYANMSDEELNRRVEDFIQRFNKQIQHQRDVY
ncbi:uncharacterized protein LOC130015567 [Mercurialis annua]|uniref:uncharacterized protein LOC130015567 n=1 Tax=Mercurialis annua TaxID=3986 RepID=UPI0024AD8E93|nr:uncharacterized protein LOC130015567 [Mercurialis annua]